jgi:hypothetical protein
MSLTGLTTRLNCSAIAFMGRLRDIAASRDLSDEEIKPALTLKHHEIGRFSQQHGVDGKKPRKEAKPAAAFLNIGQVRSPRLAYLRDVNKRLAP